MKRVRKSFQAVGLSHQQHLAQYRLRALACAIGLEDQQASTGAGLQRHLSKPVLADDLIEAVANFASLLREKNNRNPMNFYQK